MVCGQGCFCLLNLLVLNVHMKDHGVPSPTVPHLLNCSRLEPMSGTGDSDKRKSEKQKSCQYFCHSLSFRPKLCLFLVSLSCFLLLSSCFVQFLFSFNLHTTFERVWGELMDMECYLLIHLAHALWRTLEFESQRGDLYTITAQLVDGRKFEFY